MWTQARIVFYLAVAFGGGAAILQAMGAGVYDAAANTFDPDPINLNWLAGIIGGPIAAALAAVAAYLGWRK